MVIKVLTNTWEINTRKLILERQEGVSEAYDQLNFKLLLVVCILLGCDQANCCTGVWRTDFIDLTSSYESLSCETWCG